MIKKKILIATGGTGGHIFPAYSLVNILKKDTPVSLAKKILTQEHKLYPKAILKIFNL